MARDEPPAPASHTVVRLDALRVPVSEHSGDEGQFLYALKATEPGGRQLVWEGGSDRGIVAVVDFGVPVGVCAEGIYYAWGATTMLEHPVDHAALRSVPLLYERFFGSGL